MPRKRERCGFNHRNCAPLCVEFSIQEKAGDQGPQSVHPPKELSIHERPPEHLITVHNSSQMLGLGLQVRRITRFPSESNPRVPGKGGKRDECEEENRNGEDLPESWGSIGCQTLMGPRGPMSLERWAFTGAWGLEIVFEREDVHVPVKLAAFRSRVTGLWALTTAHISCVQ